MELTPCDPPLDTSNAASYFSSAAEEARSQEPPAMQGDGIIIVAGGPYLPGAYVIARTLRHHGCALPIEIWHAGPEELTPWVDKAFSPYGVAFKDAAEFYPGWPIEQLRGWPLKSAAAMATGFRRFMFLDADCFPVRDPAFAFESPEFAEHNAIFWPDTQHIKLGPTGTIWDCCGLDFQGDVEIEAGIFMVDREACWQELSLVLWLNFHSPFWYTQTLGDKDTFYLAWRKLGSSFKMGPPAKRKRSVLTRHFWFDNTPLADHKTGAGKYAIPKRRGPIYRYTADYPRFKYKNYYDEICQRWVVTDSSMHRRFLRALKELCEQSSH